MGTCKTAVQVYIIIYSPHRDINIISLSFGSVVHDKRNPPPAKCPYIILPILNYIIIM